MWALLRSILVQEREYSESIADLVETTQQSVVYCVLVLSLVGLAWVTASHPGDLLLRTMPIMLLLLGLGALVLKMVQRHQFFLSQIVWQAGLMGCIALGYLLFEMPQISLLLIFLPLTGMVTMGLGFALAIEGCVFGLVFFLGRYGAPPLSSLDSALVLVGSLGSGALGWAATNAMLTLTEWAMTSFHQARVNVAEARRQREELLETQEDLLQANRELARLSQRLKMMTQIAEEARRVKEEFVANVSHELRTPLNMVIGFCEVIAESPRVYGNLPPALLADIAAIKRNGQHLISLVNDVLDLSQIDAGRMALSKEWTTLQEIVESSVEAVKALFVSKGLYIKTELPDEEIPVFCDRTRIREVLLNLLSNAGRFTVTGGVTISAKESQGGITVSVSDTGPGISQEDLKKLFEPFQQLDNSIRRKGGSGLGLSISKRFVELHDGNMWVESELGKGTTFYFSLPRTTLTDSGADTPRAMRWINPYFQYEKPIRRSKAPSPVVIPRYVLLEKGSALKRLFDRYMDGVEAVTASSAETALNVLKESPAQALVVNRYDFQDEALPAQLFQLPFDAPLIECWVPGQDEPARRLGVVRYLTKPITRAELFQAIDQVGHEVKTILVVDDQPEMLQLIGRMLVSSEKTFTVVRAKNALNALALLKSRKPDLMILDLIMPELDGFYVLQQKAQDEAIRDIPVIVISANDPTGAPILSDNLSVHRSAGFSARELLACVRAITGILVPEAPPDGQVREAGSAG